MAMIPILQQTLLFQEYKLIQVFKDKFRVIFKLGKKVMVAE
jgi:hypothetical protein